MSPALIQEIRNALRGCVEIAVFLKIGVTRFEGTIPALKRSFILPFLIIPIVILSVPARGLYADKSFEWLSTLYSIQVALVIAIFMAVVHFMKNKLVTREDYLRTIVAYNWLSLPSYVVNIPLILMGHFGMHTWSDVSAMMLLITFYCYAYLTFMLVYSLRTNIFYALTIAMLEFMLGEVTRNIAGYWMLQSS